MLLPVLLLLSFSTVQCEECKREHFDNIKSTIDSNLNGFRTVFPKDYRVDHHYEPSMLCADRCCVFPAAVILENSWQRLLKNLWDDHLNHTFISQIIESLNMIIKKNIQAERFWEENLELEFSNLPTVSSSPEELLSNTSQLLSKWINVSCEPSIATCPVPSLAPAAEMIYTTRTRLLTTRIIRSSEAEKLSNGGPPSPTLPDVSAWILLLCGRHLLL